MTAVPATAQDLTGIWRDDQGGRYVVRQAGDEFCWSSEPTNVFCGTVIGDVIAGSWLDLPTGRFKGSGRMVLQVESPDRLVKVHQTASYRGSIWTREGTATSPPAASSSTTAGGPDAIVPSYPVDWGASPAPYRGQNVRLIFDCPAGGDPNIGTVQGTDLYTDSSPTCKAAVHAGLITFASGGRVIIEIRPGAESYRGSTRNGVDTRDYGTWLGSYVFVTSRADASLSRRTDYDTSGSSVTRVDPKVDTRFVGSWRCACNYSFTLDANGTGVFTDSRGGPPGSLYASGTFKGKWTSSGDSASLTLGPEHKHRAGTFSLTLENGQLRDQFGGVHTK